MTVAYVEHSTTTSLARHPLVSVVMPAYNHERYLKTAIEGVVGQQTDFPFELIIGNDGSADRTKEIALSYQARYPQIIRVLSSEIRAGMHENDARVLNAARGKYMAFCE